MFDVRCKVNFKQSTGSIFLVASKRHYIFFCSTFIVNIRPEVYLLMFPVEHRPPYCGPLEIAIDFRGFTVAVRKQLNAGN